MIAQKSLINFSFLIKTVLQTLVQKIELIWQCYFMAVGSENSVSNIMVVPSSLHDVIFWIQNTPSYWCNVET